MAASMPGREDVMELLLSRGANINLQTPVGRGRTALMAAAANGAQFSVSMLLRAGARTEIRSAGRTALDAAEFGAAHSMFLSQRQITPGEIPGS
eukprot:4761677-Prymnesium_polylepis.1